MFTASTIPSQVRSTPRSAAGGTIELVDVEAGIRNWNFTEVLGGLAEGDQVVMSLDIPELEDGLEVLAADD